MKIIKQFILSVLVFSLSFSATVFAQNMVDEGDNMVGIWMFSDSGTAIEPTDSVDVDFNGGDLNSGGVVYLDEQAEASTTITAKGQYWVDTATPNVAMFTDDADSDFILNVAGGPAPADATYITQIADSDLDNEQALSALSSGIMRVATTTGVVTSLTNSAGIIDNISDETGSGVMVFGTAPTFTTSIAVTDGGTIDADGIDLVTGNTYEINGDSVLAATSLGSNVLASSLTSVGTIASLVATTADINAGTVDATIGGTTPAAGTFTTISGTGELDLTGAAVKIDLNPAATGAQDVIDIVPSATITAGSMWNGIKVDGDALDPLTGAASYVHTIHSDLKGVLSADGNDAVTAALYSELPTGDTATSWGHANVMSELTAAGTQVGYGSLGASTVLSATGTYRGSWIDWDGITRDANAPVLEGMRIELPASYTDFGTSFGAYIGGGGESVTFADGTYAINTSGDVIIAGLFTADQDTDAKAVVIDSEATTNANYAIEAVTGAGATAGYFATSANSYTQLSNDPNDNSSGTSRFFRDLTAGSTNGPVVEIFDTHASSDTSTLSQRTMVQAGLFTLTPTEQALWRLIWT